MIETVRLSGGDITNSLCDELRHLWVESLVHVKPDISACETRRLYQSEQFTPEVLRRQADLAEGGIYVALADASIKAAASVGRTDALGLASDIPDVQDNNLIYLERYGARNMKRWDLFRGLVSAVLNHETGPNNQLIYLGMYIDVTSKILIHKITKLVVLSNMTRLAVSLVIIDYTRRSFKLMEAGNG